MAQQPVVSINVRVSPELRDLFVATAKKSGLFQKDLLLRGIHAVENETDSLTWPQVMRFLELRQDSELPTQMQVA